MCRQLIQKCLLWNIKNQSEISISTFFFFKVSSTTMQIWKLAAQLMWLHFMNLYSTREIFNIEVHCQQHTKLKALPCPNYNTPKCCHPEAI